MLIVVDLELLLNRVLCLKKDFTKNLIVTYIHWAPLVLVTIQIYVWQQNFHPSRSLAPEHIGLVLDTPMLIA